jgi:hypothetical protein
LYSSHFTWAAQPTHVRIFLLYLMAITFWAVWVSFRLIRRLQSVGGPKTVSIQILSNGEFTSFDLAEFALQNRNRYVELEKPPLATEHGSRKGESDVVLHLADSYFRYLWGTLSIHVYTLKRVAFLTGLFSIWIIVYGAFPTFWDFRNNSSLLPSDCLVLTLEQLCGRFALGMFISVSLYAVSVFFSQTLASRNSLWTYYHRLVVQDS